MGAVSVLRKRRGVGAELRVMGRRDWRRSGVKVRDAIVVILRYEILLCWSSIHEVSIGIGKNLAGTRDELMLWSSQLRQIIDDVCWFVYTVKRLASGSAYQPLGKVWLRNLGKMGSAG
jgi:hypothetical protein